MKLNTPEHRKSGRIASFFMIGTLAFVTACSSSNNNDDPIDESLCTPEQAGGDDLVITPRQETFDLGKSSAYVATALSGTGQIERYSMLDYTQQATYPADLSDIRAATDGTAVYQIGRFNLDSLTKFSATDSSNTIFQYSVNGTDTSANPYKVVFVNDTKAYLIRYGSNRVWVINPSAQTEEEFKTCELDLSAYDEDEPNMSDAILIGDKLYILMERLTVFNPDKVGYVAVIDVRTDTEVETGMGEEGLSGIKLNTLNPDSLQYLATTDEIYVTGRGNIFVEFNSLPGDPYQGGIETIDPATYEVAMLLDDGTADDNQNFFQRSVVVSPTVGYIVTYKNSDPVTFASINTLRSFNPTSGIMADDPVAGLVDTAITSLTVAPDGTVWVGQPGDTPGFTRIDPNTNAATGEIVATTLAPLNVVFIETE